MGVFVSRVAAYFNSEGSSLDQAEHAELSRSFGSIRIAMETLLMGSTGGRDWGDEFATLKPTGYINQLAFLAFILFIHGALMNIILGMFVEDVMKNLEPDDEQKALLFEEDERCVEKVFLGLCRSLDKNGSGKLSAKEWNERQHIGGMKAWLEMVGFRSSQVNEFFALMSASAASDEGDVVDINAFVKGCMVLKDTASCFELHAMRFELATLKDMMLELKVLQRNSLKAHRNSNHSPVQPRPRCPH